MTTSGEVRDRDREKDTISSLTNNSHLPVLERDDRTLSVNEITV